MKKSELKTIVKECVRGWLNEVSTEHIETASNNFKKWMEKSPAITQNLQKLRAEPEDSGSMWGVYLYDNRGNKMRLVGSMTPQVAKSLLSQIKDEIVTMIQSQPQQPQQMIPGQPPTGPMPPIQPPVPGQQSVQQMPGGTDTDTTMFMKK